MATEDIASLGLRFEWEQIEKANTELGKLPPNARKAGSASKQLGADASGAAKKIANDNRRASESVSVVGKAYERARGSIVAFGAAAAASIAAGLSVAPIFAFRDAMAEVSTLVDETTFDMRALEAGALSLSSQFGGGAAAQTKAYYQIISAGASSAAEATDILTAANKLAVGGVTDVTTAADGLTSVLNAYGDKVAGSADVSDSLFIAMRAGKTTIGELASSLGQVAPLAAQIGVSFDELTASIAALTKGGISTAQSVTGVRAILATVAKPTKEAADLAAELGIAFDSAAVQSMGFQGFIEQIVEKTGGSTDQLSTLFSGVEALVPVLALSGQAGVDFTNILEDMGEKAGATEAAFAKMANSPGFQAGRVWSAFEAEIIAAGSAVGDIMVPALRLLADNMGLIFGLVQTVGATMAVYFAPAILTGIASGFVFIGTAAVGAIKAIGIAIAANPLGALIVAISAVVAASYFLREEIKSVFGVDLFAIVQSAANFLINSFTAAYENLKFIFGNFSDIVAAGITGAVNAVITGVNSMVNAAISGINKLIEGVNSMASTLGVDKAAEFFGFSGQLGTIDPFEGASTFANPAADRLAAANSAQRSKIQDIMSRNNFGSSGVTSPATSTNDATSEIDALNDAAKAAAGSMDDLGSAATGAGNAASGATKKAEEDLSRYKDTVSKTRDTMVDFAKETTNAFLTDLRNGLKNGESFFQAFGNAAMNVLDKIIEKVQTQLTDALFNVGGGMGGAGGGGGLFGGLFSGLFGGGKNFFPAAPTLSAGLFHDGGMAGHSATTYRNVNPGLFSGAPRYHSGGVAGLKPGEVPAILKENEPIFRDMDHARRSVGSTGTAVNDNRVYNIDARGADAGVEERLKVLLKNYDKNRKKRYEGGGSGV